MVPLMIRSLALAIGLAGLAAAQSAPQRRRQAGAPTALATLAAQMRPGTWAELKAEGMGDKLFSDGGHHVLEYTDEAVWDPVSRRILFSGEGHGGPNRFIEYDERANRWSNPPLPDFANVKNWGFVHAYDHQALDPASGIYYRAIYGKPVIHQYSPKDGTWSKLTDIPESTGVKSHITRGFEFFPEMGSLIVYLPTQGLFSFSLSEKKWTTLATKLGTYVYHQLARYNPVHKVVVFGGGNDSKGYASKELWKLDASGKITPLKEAPISFGINQTIFTVDPAGGKYLVFAKDRSVTEYDVAADAWTLLKGETPPIFTFGEAGIFGAVAAPVADYGVILFVKFDRERSKAYLYKPSAAKEKR